MSAKQAKKDRKEKKLNESDKEKLERWGKTTDFNLVKPFGPNVGFFKAPSEVLKTLIELTDKVLEDENRVDWGNNLVGQVKEEPWVSNEMLKEAGIYQYLNMMLYNYVWNSLSREGHELEKLEVHLDHMWVVSQYAGEYNPVHFHTYCDLSSVMWLKIPEMEDRLKSKKLPEYKTQRDGHIEFIYKTACPTGLEKGSMSFLPEEGQMAIFPSNLLHTVYPFEGLGERRSVAFNSHWNAILKNGKMFDKAMRPPSDQNHEDYKKTLKSKGEVSGFAERKQRSLNSGDSEAKNEV
jgi:uncharacterized protein (TIGR02466 family)